MKAPTNPETPKELYDFLAYPDAYEDESADEQAERLAAFTSLKSSMGEDVTAEQLVAEKAASLQTGYVVPVSGLFGKLMSKGGYNA